MTDKELQTVLEAVSYVPDGKRDEVTQIILKAASESITLEKLKALTVTQKPKERKQEGFIKFTKREIDSMPEPIRVLLIYNERLIKYREHAGVYNTRYRRDGYNIDVSSANLDELKMKFMIAVTQARQLPHENKKYPYLKDFIPQWINIKKMTLKESTLKSYIVMIDAHVLPPFGEKRLNAITRADIQEYLTKLVEEEKFRTAQKLKLLLSAIFDVAAEDYGIKSPMVKIALPHYEVKKGKALTKAEEKKLVDYCIAHKENKAASALLLLLYTGMRIGELKTATLHENYIECETEKTRKGYAAEFRKIPISPMLKRVMPYINFDSGITCAKKTISDGIKRIFPDRHPHELRYTYITRCKECGCNLELVMLWDGHKFDKDVASSAVDRGYTTYSDEFYFGEAEKINYLL